MAFKQIGDILRFLRARDFFGALVPGAVVTYVIVWLSPGTFLEPHLQPHLHLIKGNEERWVAFFIAALIVGYALEGISSILDPIYDITYRRIKRRVNDSLYEFARSRAVEAIPSILETGSVYRWTEVDVSSRDKADADRVENLQAVSKMFRSLTLVLLFAAVALFLHSTNLLAFTMLAIALLFFWIFSERRWNATCFVYQRFNEVHGSKP